MSMSAKVKAALQALQSHGALLSLFTISHADITTLYYTDNNVDVVYGGQRYTATPGVHDWPSESSSSVSSATLTLYKDNALIAALRGTSGFVNVNVQVLWYDESAALVLNGAWLLDGSEHLDGTAGVLELVKDVSFVITDFEYDDEILQATLAVDDALDYEVLPIELTPQVAPGLFV